MSKTKYKNAPVPTENMPKGIPYIIVNEAAERFSFYGMRAILMIFMTKYLVNSAGESDTMSDEQAMQVFHLFVMAAYLFPLLGSLISDGFFGKYRTIIWLSLMYCFGHAAIAWEETRFYLFLGLILISIGSGGIKPCVSAHVGDQFGKRNAHLLPRIFSIFYFSINLGAAISMALTPKLMEWYGPSVAFGVPGVLMAIATLTFWMGRNKFVHIPPGGKAFIKEVFSPDGLRAMRQLVVIYIFIAMFWCLFDQTSSKWVLQAESMDRFVPFLWITSEANLPEQVSWTFSIAGKIVYGYSHELLPSQPQAANSIMVLMLIPFFNMLVYPLLGKIWQLTPLRKVGIGFFISLIPFLIAAWLQVRIDAGEAPSVWWQILAYLFMTGAEVLISITALEYSYTQAPKKMKSWIMGMFLAAVAFGNLFTAIINWFMELGILELKGVNYYLFFTAAMAVTAILFVFVAMRYTETTYIQDDAEEAAA